MGSPGVDEIRWTRPVRPGDTLPSSITVLEARPSQSKPDRGVLRFRVEVHNQDGEPVVQMTGERVRRPPTETAAHPQPLPRKRESGDLL